MSTTVLNNNYCSANIKKINKKLCILRQFNLFPLATCFIFVIQYNQNSHQNIQHIIMVYSCRTGFQSSKFALCVCGYRVHLMFVNMHGLRLQVSCCLACLHICISTISDCIWYANNKQILHRGMCDTEPNVFARPIQRNGSLT